MGKAYYVAFILQCYAGLAGIRLILFIAALVAQMPRLTRRKRAMVAKNARWRLWFPDKVRFLTQ